MQLDMLEHWKHITSRDGEPSSIEDEDFGFANDAEYVKQTGQIFILSNFNVMPNAGGWDDQDALWCDDMITYLKGYKRAEWEATNMPKGNFVSEDVFKDINTLK